MSGSPEADGVIFKGGTFREVREIKEKGKEAKGAISGKSCGGHLSGALEGNLLLTVVPTREQRVWPSQFKL